MEGSAWNPSDECFRCTLQDTALAGLLCYQAPAGLSGEENRLPDTIEITVKVGKSLASCLSTRSPVCHARVLLGKLLVAVAAGQSPDGVDVVNRIKSPSSLQTCQSMLSCCRSCQR